MATYKIIGCRYLRKYTAEAATPVYSAAIDAQKVVDSLCGVPWEKSGVKRAEMPVHGADENVADREKFDAALFCAGHKDGKHTAYANAACYKFTFPDSAIEDGYVCDAGGNPVTMSQFVASVTSDPYNSQGARIALLTNSTGIIPTNCNTCRTGDVHVEGVAPRTSRTVSGTEYWYCTTADATLEPEGSLNLQKYVFLFVVMESYSTVRGNWLEGSSLIENLCTLTTSAGVKGWTDGETYDLTGDGEGWEIVKDGHLPPREYRDDEYLTLETGVRYLTVQNDGTKCKGKQSNSVSGIERDAGCEFWGDGVNFQVVFPHRILNVFDMPCDLARLEVGTSKYRSEPIVAVSGQGADCLLPELGVHFSDLNHYDNSVKVTGLNSSLVAAAAQGITAAYVKARSDAATSYSYPLDVYVFTKGGGSTSPVGTMTFSFYYNKCTAFSKNNSYSFDSSLLVDFAVPYIITPYTYDYTNPVAAVNGMALLRVASNKITAVGGASFFPAGGISFVGTVRQIRAAMIDTTSTSLRFVVTGELTSVNSVACTNCAYVEVTTGGAVTVTRPYFDAGLSFEDASAATVVRRRENVWIVTSAGAITYSGTSQNGIMVFGQSGISSDSSQNKKSIRLGSDSSCIVNGGYSGGSGLIVPFRDYGFIRSYQGYPFRIENATDAQVVNGLRALFARFEGGEMEVPTNTAAARLKNDENARSGVAFSLHCATDVLSVPISETGNADKNVRFFGIGSSVLMVPFSNPGKNCYSKLRLDWSRCDGVTVTAEARVNVWFKPSYMSEVYPDCSNPALYIARQKTVDGWTLIGTFCPVDGTTVDFDFAADDYRYGTFMLTAFVDVSTIKTTSGLAEFVGIGRMVHRLVDSSSGCDVTFPAEERAFIPDMKLI